MDQTDLIVAIVVGVLIAKFIAFLGQWAVNLIGAMIFE